MRIRNMFVWTMISVFLAAGLFWTSPALAGTDDLLERIEDKVTSFTLDNGLTFLVIERHQAPVASFVTVVDVGSVNEPAGRSGLAHMLEHMAFKGTSRIGTTNWDQEQEVLDKLEAAYTAWWRASQDRNADREEVARLRQRFEELQAEAKSYVKSNAFASIIESHGGTKLNAGTSSEYTMYFCSLPSNRAELWFSLESERLRDPVWREFYTEKEVVLEERRMRVDSDPIGRLMERVLATSFLAHPYRQPVIGWESEIKAASPTDLTKLYQEFYVPGNMVCAVAGDVQPEQIQKWARQYFGLLEPGPDPSLVATHEPAHQGPRQLELSSRAQPFLVRTYPGVSRFDPKAPALNLLSKILSHGRTSRLYTALVQEQRLAAQIGTHSGYPADIDPGLFMLYAVPNKGIKLSELTEEIEAQLEKVRNSPVSQEELQRAKVQTRARLIRGLDSNLGLAQKLAKAQALEGDWRRPFNRLEEIEAVQPEDIRQAAVQVVDRRKMTQGRLVHTEHVQTGGQK